MYSLTQLLQTLKSLKAQKQFVLMKDLLDLKIEDSNNLAVLRLDVERDLNHHLHFAEETNAIGIPCTFYFHSRKECYDPLIFKKIENLGHEVGFHHECIDRCRGDFYAAKILFEKEVNKFTKDGFPPDTVCAHGESGLYKIGYKFNYELFTKFPDLLSSCNISAEVYNDIIPKWNPIYVSDVFSSYRQFWQKIEGSRQQRHLLVILVHPHRWHDGYLKSEWETAIDLAQALKNKILKFRSYNSIEL
jgi:hypothetical protein